MGSLILAVRFLTVVPVPGRELLGVSALGRAAWWFPVVGLLLGIGLDGTLAALQALFPPLLASALLVTAWKAVTGGIHLDGLADVLDGLAGRDPAQRLAIMRDSRVGVFGAAGLVLFLLLVVAAVADLPDPVRGRLLILAPMVGRAAPLLVGGWLPPGRGSARPSSSVSPDGRALSGRSGASRSASRWWARGARQSRPWPGPR